VKDMSSDVIFNSELFASQVFSHFERVFGLVRPSSIQEAGSWCSELLERVGKLRNVDLVVKYDLQNFEKTCYSEGEVIERRSATVLGPPKEYLVTDVQRVRGRSVELSFITIPCGAILQLSDFGAIYFDKQLNILHDISTPYYPLIFLCDIDVRARFSAVAVDPRPAICFFDRFSEANYAHWLLDGCSRLVGARHGDVVVTMPLNSRWQTQLLELFNSKECEFDQLVAGELKSYASIRVDIYGGGAVPHPAYKANAVAIDHLRDAAARQLSSPITAVPEALVIKRYGARELVNSSKIEDMLVSRGYAVTLVDCAKIPVVAQWALFSRADVIVSVHGAALANIVFAKPGSLCIEIFPENYGNQEFWMLSHSVSCDYIALTDVKDVGDSRARYRSLKLNQSIVSKLADLVPASA